VALTAAHHREAALRHRGPDDAAILYKREALRRPGRRFALALAATRLSLLDFEGGAQPFVGRRGSWLVFNGEIYNWRELRRELAADGWEPRTRCDTEVVSEMLERHGAGALARFDGMFAIAFHNQGRLLLARDPFGIKPLYYAWNAHDWLAFASESKALLRFSSIRPRVSPEALFETRVFGYPLGGRSSFEGIAQLEPGTVVSVEARADGTLDLEPTVYEPFPWHADAAADVRAPEDDLTDRVAQEFVAAVRQQLLADHPVGIFPVGRHRFRRDACLSTGRRGLGAPYLLRRRRRRPAGPAHSTPSCRASRMPPPRARRDPGGVRGRGARHGACDGDAATADGR